LLKKLTCMILMTTSLFIMTACINENTNIDNAERTFLLMPLADSNSDFNSLLLSGAEREAEINGWYLIIDNGDDSATSFQNGIRNNVAGIAISPITPDIFSEEIENAMEYSVPVVTFFSDIYNHESRNAYIGPNNLETGKELGRRSAEYLLERNITSGSIAMIMSNSTQTTFTERAEGIKKGFAETIYEYDTNFSWLTPIVDGDNIAISLREFELQMIQNPNMVAVFSLGTEASSTGAMEVIRLLNRTAQIHHFSFDFIPIPANTKGLVAGIMNQENPYLMGRQIVRTMIDIAEGRSVASENYIESKWIELQN